MDTHSFEDHCWKDIVPDDVRAIYRDYVRETTVGERPALVLVDVYNLVYEGGPRPVIELVDQYPSSCGEYAWAALEPTRELLGLARDRGLPIFYTTTEVRPEADPRTVSATRRRGGPRDPHAYAIHPELAPREGEVVIYKQRASGFFGTPLVSQLLQRDVNSVIVVGETTSGCVRATAVDAYSYGFHVSLVEECCFDRSLLSHKVNLFDLHHKYGDVLHLAEARDQLRSLAGVA